MGDRFLLLLTDCLPLWNIAEVLAAFLWLFAPAFGRAFMNGRAGLLAQLVGRGVFMITFNIARMPTLRFGLALCLVAEAPARPRSGHDAGIDA